MNDCQLRREALKTILLIETDRLLHTFRITWRWLQDHPNDHQFQAILRATLAQINLHISTNPNELSVWYAPVDNGHETPKK
jgi:hypothetical protein